MNYNYNFTYYNILKQSYFYIFILEDIVYCSVTSRSSLLFLFIRVAEGWRETTLVCYLCKHSFSGHNYGGVAHCTVWGFSPLEYSSLPQISLRAHHVQPLCIKILFFPRAFTSSLGLKVILRVFLLQFSLQPCCICLLITYMYVYVYSLVYVY